MTTDPIADMLTRIRNAQAVKKHDIVLPTSKIKYEIAKILKKESFINDVELIDNINDTENKKPFNELKISLKYKKSGKSVLSSIQKISKPGRRVYVKKDALPKVLNNLGIAIISTSKGLMTNKEARQKGLGGEVICEIY